MKQKVLKHKYISITVLVVIIILLVVWGRKASTDSGAYTAKLADFTKVVSVSGKVIPVSTVDLSFETSGTVASVPKDVGATAVKGDIIAALDSSEVSASRDKAYADLLSAQAELAKLQSGSYDQVSLDKQQVINTIIDAYTKSDDAVRNKVDQFFNDGRNLSPKIKYDFYNSSEDKYQINDDRRNVEDSLVAFDLFANSLTTDTYKNDDIKTAEGFVKTIKNFLDEVSLAVNSFILSDGLTQTMVDKYKSDVATARTNVTGALLNLASYEDKLRSSISDIPVQEAKVKAAEANVKSFDAQIAKTRIVAPFAGVVSYQDAKVGGAVSASSKVASLISTDLQIEVYVPEISIPGILVGNKATVTLDAYPDVSFDATVSHIDPAETVKDGVSNYKVNLVFTSTDPRIRSGLTGDVSIETEKRANILSIGERSLITDSGHYYVYKKGKDDYVKTEVQIGVKDGRGNVEITSGLVPGDVIELTPAQ